MFHSRASDWPIKGEKGGTREGQNAPFDPSLRYLVHPI